MKNLDNKVVVITGAGSGMGREMALIAARQGSLLAVSDWDEQGLAETVDLLKGAGARELRSDVVDVADRAAVAALAEAVVERLELGEEGLVRAGCACYTYEEEIERLLEGVREIARFSLCSRR